MTFGESMALFRADPAESLRTARRFSRSIAGAESNLAIGLCRLGCLAGWFGRVGDDPLGLGVLDTLRGEGVDVSRAAVDGDANTGVLVRDTHGERRIDVVYARHGSAGSRLSVADIDQAYLASARVLHVTGITPALSRTAREATAEAVRLAADAGVAVCFDPNLRRRLWPDMDVARRMLLPLLESAQIVLAGHAEAMALTGQATPGKAGRWLADHGAMTVAVKLGADGALGIRDGQSYHGQALAVHPVDPIGAGDAFDAAFLAAWLRGADLADCVDDGNLAAGLSIQVSGDIEGLPYRREMDERRANNLETNR
ncbi:MAG TPA: sugar kinase [Streptosporangiaceae bacterium]|nr:sugar kinase [Streptosporangiaceae bacterium]